MPERVNVTAAKVQLSRLIDRAANGEEIVICRGGQPIARLVGLPPSRKIGRLHGQIWMSDDFDEPDEEIERMFGMRD
ncbi:MAG TPA: type II toxin-antitoxin system prevent-host-death family antitoxin [Solirubrobacteraceae bacterium]|jgi:prevent-host-death family protein